MTPVEWKDWLEKQRKECNDLAGMDLYPGEVIAKIFDLTLYDANPARSFSETIVEVLEVIGDCTTSKYIIKGESEYYRYLMVVNFASVAKLINWGTSIRGAWFEDTFKVPFDPVAGLCRFEGNTYPTIPGKGEMVNFVKGMRLFLNANPEPAISKRKFGYPRAESLKKGGGDD